MAMAQYLFDSSESPSNSVGRWDTYPKLILRIREGNNQYKIEFLTRQHVTFQKVGKLGGCGMR